MTAAEVSPAPTRGRLVDNEAQGRVMLISLGADLRLCSGSLGFTRDVPFGWESAASPGHLHSWAPSLPLLLTGTWWAREGEGGLVAKKLAFKALSSRLTDSVGDSMGGHSAQGPPRLGAP